MKTCRKKNRTRLKFIKEKDIRINPGQKRNITIQINFILPIIKMREKTLKFDNIVVNKKKITNLSNQFI